jgi:poly-gamma-glutamate synthesis protein (capsule biosynthesis protein)
MPDFRSLASAGAVIVSGSQSHYPQTMTFVDGNFVHYGLGNLFFDQMDQLATRQGFVDRHVFYDGRYLGVELLTTVIEDYARPRPMTPAERNELLSLIFSLSHWAGE